MPGSWRVFLWGWLRALTRQRPWGVRNYPWVSTLNLYRHLCTIPQVCQRRLFLLYNVKLESSWHLQSIATLFLTAWFTSTVTAMTTAMASHPLRPTRPRYRPMPPHVPNSGRDHCRWPLGTIGVLEHQRSRDRWNLPPKWLRHHESTTAWNHGRWGKHGQTGMEMDGGCLDSSGCYEIWLDAMANVCLLHLLKQPGRQAGLSPMMNIDE